MRKVKKERKGKERDRTGRKDMGEGMMVGGA